MDINNPNRDVYDVPLLTTQLAEYLTEQFSADKQIRDGLLSDPNVVRTEGYLLGFLGGLGYAQEVLRVILVNQEGISLDVVDETDNFIPKR